MHWPTWRIALPCDMGNRTHGYAQLAMPLRPRRRLLLLALSLAAMALVGVYVATRFPSRWLVQQALLVTGADQLFIFGKKYLVLELCLLVLWVLLLTREFERQGLHRMALDPRFHIFLLSAASVVFIPTGILFPGYNHMLVFIADRMSLCVAVCICALLGTASPKQA